MRRYNGPKNGPDTAFVVAVSPDGSKVFVTGSIEGTTLQTTDFATLAYGTSSGAPLWLSRYDGPAAKSDLAHGLAVSPDGAIVFVTGECSGVASDTDFATIAYSA